MIKRFGSAKLAVKAARELGMAQAFWYAVYQAGLRTGYYRRATPPGAYIRSPYSLHSPFRIPDQEPLAALLKQQAVVAVQEADEITVGKVRLFGGPPTPLILKPPDTSKHWTFYEAHPETWGVADIKFLWEPARFGWAYTLGRAFVLTGDERYPASFWEHFETFLTANPPNQGPNWSSAQEVALRLLAFLFAACAFNRSSYSTPDRQALLAGAIAAHAQRIPATISYSLAQNNNHLITEALGLYAAGIALPDHPQARSWRQKGWGWLNFAFTKQIQRDGVYAQHSMNYHRLMLQAALQATLFGKRFPRKTLSRLAAATKWLLAQVDPQSGLAPNLGSNDGAYIFPLGPGGFSDFRPTAQAAARAFLDKPAFRPGPWDEMSLWLGQKTGGIPLPPLPESPAVFRLGSEDNRAALRAVHFYSRPSHADQLHVELWWRGENLALDAGTYRYTASAPWDNALARTCIHNTVEVNDQDQMTRAGRFLWLDWAQAAVLDTSKFQSTSVAAEHYGYRRLGIIHRRVLKQVKPDHWQVADHLLPDGSQKSLKPQNSPYLFRLHWLLPDWPWSLEGGSLTLAHPAGRKVVLTLSYLLPDLPVVKSDLFSLVRAGKPLAGPKKVRPILGWYAPTYGRKIPALSFSIRVRSTVPLTLLSDWVLEE